MWKHVNYFWWRFEVVLIHLRPGYRLPLPQFAVYFTYLFNKILFIFTPLWKERWMPLTQQQTPESIFVHRGTKICSHMMSVKDTCWRSRIVFWAYHTKTSFHCNYPIHLANCHTQFSHLQNGTQYVSVIEKVGTVMWQLVLELTHFTK